MLDGIDDASLINDKVRESCVLSFDSGRKTGGPGADDEKVVDWIHDKLSDE
jgi:hypothetical protein